MVNVILPRQRGPSCKILCENYLAIVEQKAAGTDGALIGSFHTSILDDWKIIHIKLHYVITTLSIYYK